MEVGGAPLFFRESVVAAIEVKTNYEPAKLSEVLDAASSVRRVKAVPVATFQMGSQGPWLRSEPRRVLCGVFYFRGLNTRSELVHSLNSLLSSRVSSSRCSLEDINAPDFFFSAKAGLIVRNWEFNTLRTETGAIEGLNDVYDGLEEDEEKPGAYRRVFGDSDKWRGLQTLILELTERCQRYASSYASLSAYA